MHLLIAQCGWRGSSICSANCGGPFGAKLRRAGFDGLIIRGRADHPSCIEITNGEISIREAPEMWGLDTEETQKRFDRRYGTAGFVSRCNEAGILPTRNFQKGRFDGAGLISGERLIVRKIWRRIFRHPFQGAGVGILRKTSLLTVKSLR